MHLTQCLELVTPFMQSGQTKQLEGIIDWWGVPLGMHVRTHDTLLTTQNIGSSNAHLCATEFSVAGRAEKRDCQLVFGFSLGSPHMIVGCSGARRQLSNHRWFDNCRPFILFLIVFGGCGHVLCAFWQK